jgi:hypothetical protein
MCEEESISPDRKPERNWESTIPFQDMPPMA